MKRLLFITGARSEYGISRPLLKALRSNPEIDLGVVAHGMHFSEQHGYSISDVHNDGHRFLIEVDTYDPFGSKSAELTGTITQLHKVLEESKPDSVLIIGDRMEAMGAAMSAHLRGVPIIHSGGGHVTAGSADNAYRYILSTLATLHLSTSKNATARLKSLPQVDAEKVFFVGSVAIDAVRQFLKQPYSLGACLPDLKIGPYALVNFHPTTVGDEDLSGIMKAAVRKILEHDIEVLITAPNNDAGYQPLMDAIDSLIADSRVHYQANLGVPNFYAAVFSSEFVVGNSSSGVMEAPYFGKQVIDVGTRQEGRDKDIGIQSVPASAETVVEAIADGFKRNWPKTRSSNLYGNGQSVAEAHRLINAFLQSLPDS